MRRALIIGPGGLRGAYGGGVVATLCRTLGHGYFEKVVGCSAGAYTGSYAVSGQPDQIESIWRECVHSDLLVDVSRIFKRKRPLLDLFYLNDILRSDRYRLSLKHLLESPTAFEIVVTDKKTGMPHYFTPQSEEEFFLLVRASAAVPLMHPRVRIDGREFVDGGLSDPIPLERVLSQGFDEVVIVCNRPIENIGVLASMFLGGYSILTSHKNVKLVKKRLNQAAKLHRTYPNHVHIIFPSSPHVHRWQFDSEHATLNQLVDLGIQDAKQFLSSY